MVRGPVGTSRTAFTAVESGTSSRTTVSRRRHRAVQVHSRFRRRPAHRSRSHPATHDRRTVRVRLDRSHSSRFRARRHRALAVLAVMLFHGNVGRAEGGFIGVDVFLVLSGFLITTLLFRELESTGRIAFRRLLAASGPPPPARAVPRARRGRALRRFVATNDEALGLRGDLLGSLLYVQNWRLVLAGQSYFAQFGAPSPLRHMWSLRSRNSGTSSGRCCSSASSRWPTQHEGRRDDHARARGGISVAHVGAVPPGQRRLARVLRHRHPGPGPPRRRGAGHRVVRRSVLQRRSTAVVAQILGVGGLAFLVWVTVERSESWTRLYRGGFSMVAVAAAAVIAAVMTRGPLRWAWRSHRCRRSG